MTVYFRSPRLVITERTIRVRIPGGWQVWVIDGLTGFGTARADAPVSRWNWGLGFSGVVGIVLAVQLRGWALVLPFVILLVIIGWYVLADHRIRRSATAQMWARRRGVPVLLYELPEREFDAAARALRRVLDRRDEERGR